MFAYLAENLNAPIPSVFLNCLCAVASKSEALERQLALHGTRAAGRGDLKELFRRTTNLRERLLLIQWLLFPSPRYLCWVDKIQDSPLVFFHYARRPMQHLLDIFNRNYAVPSAPCLLNRSFLSHQFSMFRKAWEIAPQKNADTILIRYRLKMLKRLD